MSGFEITYGRAWEASSLSGPAYVPPVTLPPVLAATRVRIMARRARPSRANPAGSVKSIEWLWPDSVLAARGDTAPPEPPGARAMLKVLLSSPGPEIIVSYARGYDVNADGENVRRPIWEEVAVPATEEDAGRTKRTKVGEMDPEPVDSIVVAGVWHDPASGHAVTFAEGWWLDGSPQHGRIWQRGGHLEQMGWTPFMKRLKEIVDGFGANDRLL